MVLGSNSIEYKPRDNRLLNDWNKVLLFFLEITNGSTCPPPHNTINNFYKHYLGASFLTLDLFVIEGGGGGLPVVANFLG